jgi:hypothetical protein
MHGRGQGGRTQGAQRRDRTALSVVGGTFKLLHLLLPACLPPLLLTNCCCCCCCCCCHFQAG